MALQLSKVVAILPGSFLESSELIGFRGLGV